eukprot:CAMPEP_0116024108 /NCGR_PEP_ID=MMETSP0321-20121206/12092_1 /TAXON_ID=163516 /ORGANISM="Leptocylindrus danicus var. danicus, Strain B650" /LENGTH=533 /DNA_ID=CAMNT_0003495719 /DNA_START=77 /DNA_END=1678 /DNA_ORIENTATION=-
MSTSNSIKFTSTLLLTLAALSSAQNLRRGMETTTSEIKIDIKEDAEVNPDIMTVGYEKIAKTYYGRKGGDSSYSKGKGKSGKGGSESGSKSGKGGKGGSKSGKSGKGGSKSGKSGKGGKGGSDGSKSKGKGGSKSKGKGGSKSKDGSKSKGKGGSGSGTGGSKGKGTGGSKGKGSIKGTPEPTISPAPSDKPSAAPVIAPVASPSAGPTGAPSKGPTQAPVPSPSAAPTYPCGVEPLTRRDMIFDILTPEVVSGAMINDVGSSANLAFEWLVGEDDLYICPDDPKVIQRFVMGKIYFQMNGDDWLQCSRPSTSSDNKPSCDVPPNQGYEGAEWLDAGHECDWAYVKCNTDRCITHIEVDENLVTGTLVDEVDWLMFLQVYTMDGDPNEITGTIPTQFGNLTDLRILDLDENALTGTVPEEIYITAKGLEQLDLDSNQLTGTISTVVGTLTSMTFLQYFSNPMTGTIPTEIGNLKELGTLGLYNMDLTGSVADEICANRQPAGNIEFLWTDCGTDDVTTIPQVECTCCNFCFIG